MGKKWDHASASIVERMSSFPQNNNAASPVNKQQQRNTDGVPTQPISGQNNEVRRGPAPSFEPPTQPVDNLSRDIRAAASPQAKIFVEEVTRPMTNRTLDARQAGPAGGNQFQRGAAAGPRLVPDDLQPEVTSPLESQTRVYQASSGGQQLVVGWLVVVKGDGVGKSLELFTGDNSIERSVKSLGFTKDEEISRDKHIIINYDNVNNSFSIVRPFGKPNAYLNGSQLIPSSNIPLNPGDMIVLSRNTALMFVELCGQNFKWDDINVQL